MNRNLFPLLAVLSIGLAGLAFAQATDYSTPSATKTDHTAATPAATTGTVSDNPPATRTTTSYSSESDMPQTASPLTAVGLIGVGAMLLGGTIGYASRRPESRS